MLFVGKILSSIPVRDKVYTIKLYVLKFLIDPWQVDGFLLELWNPLSLPVTKSLNTDENGVKHNKSNDEVFWQHM
jgi:hypothetical protein